MGNPFKIKKPTISLEIKYTLIVVIFLSIVFSSCHRVKKPNWPKIKDVHFYHHFEQNISNRLFVTIESQSGNPLYQLDVRYLPESFDNLLPYDYDYSGMLHGRLYPIEMKNETHPNIFINEKNATRDWQCCSRFLESDVIGLANAPKDRKLVQSYKARGMSITIAIYNVRLDQDQHVHSFDFDIKFTNDSTANNPIALPTPK